MPQNNSEAKNNYSHHENKDKRHLKKKRRNKEQVRNSRKRAVKRNKKYVEDYKRSYPCSCGETEPCCLSFHHNNGDKTGTISDMVNRGYSIKRIKEEIDKCVMLCLNCHAKFHNKKEENGNHK